MNPLNKTDSPSLAEKSASAPSPKTGLVPKLWYRPVYFPDWQSVLALEPFDADQKTRIVRGVIGFLGHCKATRSRASIFNAKAYLEAGAGQGKCSQQDRDALRWFFVSHRREYGDAPPDYRPSATPTQPMPIPEGTPEWEATLIRTIRLRGFLWNTEQTYCWCLRRYAREIAPKTPDQAGPDEVRAHLTDLVVNRGISASAQRLALNALVFFYREALKRDLGDLGEFKRARSYPRMPVVMSREELDKVFDQLRGTWRTMAELQYGSGLRITELLELRIQSLDLARGRLIVRAGKGNKDRVTILPESLIPKLQTHLIRLRELFAKDRENQVPGVWLPRGLERKYQGAGTQWQWQWVFPMNELSRDRQTGIIRRHHVIDGSFQRAVKVATTRAGLDKRVTPHIFRHYVEYRTMWSSSRFTSEIGAAYAA